MKMKLYAFAETICSEGPLSTASPKHYCLNLYISFSHLSDSFQNRHDAMKC